MTTEQLQPSRRTIEAEAAAWIAQLDGSDPSREDLAALREWMDRSPAHRQAVERLSTLWDDLNLLTQLAAPRGEDAAPRRQVRFGARSARLAAAAAVVLVVGAGGILAWQARDAARPVSPAMLQAGSYRTEIGEQRTVVLADGSRLTLNTASRVVVDLDSRSRDVHLIHGEAHFEVASDAHRPFRVYAGSGFVRAVGTAFTVHLEEEGQVSVAVAEGVVELGTPAAGSTDAVADPPAGQSEALLARVNAGQIATFGRKVESIRSVEPKEMSRRLAWRDGMLRFDGEPLARVVREVSRYTTEEIIIADPELRDLRIGGYFKAGETRAMLEALQSGFEVRIERIDEDTVRLHAGR